MFETCAHAPFVYVTLRHVLGQVVLVDYAVGQVRGEVAPREWVAFDGIDIVSYRLVPTIVIASSGAVSKDGIITWESTVTAVNSYTFARSYELDVK